ncbi:MAG: hypothetical protein RLY30_1577 [Pseudomonadota bacterium]
MIALALAGLAPPARANEPIWQVGQPVQLPPLELLSGESIQWPALKGKVVVIEFWGSWCPFCSRQNPLLESFYKRHKGKGLEVVTISLDKTKAAAEQYMQKGKYSFQAGMATAAWRSIYSQRKGLPQLFVIDRRGVLVAAEVREMMDDDIEDIAKWL